MKKDKLKPANSSGATTLAANSPKPAPAARSVPAVPRTPPLFRKIDWWAFAATTLLVFIGYLLTLAPNLTLEDSGELATASMYAGIPHPPGYPVWTIYTWAFTKILPFSNIAWRVGVASAFAGAVACGLLSLMVSRGSSMMVEGIADLKSLDRKWENALCLVAGFVSGMLMGFNGYFWSQAVIVEVYTFSVLSLMIVLICLLHFVYNPNQRRYLYWAMFVFGVCFTNHQTLIVAAVGIEVTIAAVQARLGRDLFLGNSIIYVAALMMKANGGLTLFDGNPPLFVIFNVIGVLSMLACGWLALQTKGLGTEWKSLMIMGALWVVGAAFYFYMPLASMSVPPLNWGYPRTVEGFWHALTRGQYEKANPVNIMNDPMRFVHQIGLYFEGAAEEFNPVYLLIGIIPWLLYRRMQKRERSWMVGLFTIYLGLALLLLILLNPSPDRQSQSLNRVFFTSSHVMIAIWIGYGLTFIGALLLTQYEKYRSRALWGAAAATGIWLYSLTSLKTFYWLDKFDAWFGIGLGVAAVLMFWLSRQRAPIVPLLVLYAMMPIDSICDHWWDNEQSGHMFGYWFGHDMFTPPFKGPDGKLTYDKKLREAALKGPNAKLVYPEMDRDTVLFGGTDPGRFCPTYTIYCESFIPRRCKMDTDPDYDRRDVYIITQNALADATYLSYIRAHYNRSTQKDPPFFTEFFKTDALAPLDNLFAGLGARIEAGRRERGVYPPKEIHTPTPEDSQQSFQDYIADAQRRLAHDKDSRFNNEPRQIKPGEQVEIRDNRVQVSGQVAVMAINGLLTKVIFDKNPDHEFYVEESFPLDWMFPYITPFGIIMKINRQPIPELTEDIVRRDHEFWADYSGRFIGNWVTYETPISNICAFAERIYLHKDLKGFKGDPKFVRDDNAQKAFSKLRSAIAGVYAWRINGPRSPAERARLVKEADFAFKQAYAFCPYSPEAVYRYVNLLVSLGRVDDALLISQTCKKLDPENGAIQGLIDQLKGMRSAPQNLQEAFNRASTLISQQQTQQGVAILDQILNMPAPDQNGAVNAALSVAEAFRQLNDFPRLEQAMKKVTTLLTTSPEAWYDLAAVQIVLGKNADSLQSLQKALKLNSERLAKPPVGTNQPPPKDLHAILKQDPRFQSLTNNPAFQKLLQAK